LLTLHPARFIAGWLSPGRDKLNNRSTVETAALLPFALCAAVTVGLGEALVLLARRIFGLRLAFVGPDMLWMAPVGYAALFASMLGVCLLLGFVFPRVPMQRLFLFATGFLGIAGFLQTLSMLQVHPFAIVLLAAGIGYQLSRTVPRWTSGRAMRRAAAFACALVLLVAGVRAWQRAGGTGNPGAGNPGAKDSADRPNILLLVWDTVRELNVSLHGYSRPTTPFLERWAAKGVVFDRALATSSWTLPSHASLFTGRFPHELSADFQAPLDGAFPTLAEVLGNQGYRTAGFVANPYYTSEETGLARGFDVWQDYRLSPREILLGAGAVQWLVGWRSRTILRRHDLKRAPEVTNAFLRWVDRRDRRPFFAFLNYFDAHTPYYAPPGILQRFAGADPESDHYDAAIAHLDAELERLLAALEARGLLKHTIVVLTSDHGEQFGGRGLYDHANSLYRQVVQVPLVLVAPGRAPEGLRVPYPVSLRNVPATLLDLAGIPGHLLPGQSHTRFWRGTPIDSSQDSPVLSELTPSPGAPQIHRNARGELRSLVEGPYHYILNADGSDELFDLRTDPLEQRSLRSRKYLPLMSQIWSRLHPFDFGFPRKLPGIQVSN
jgi:arylsulfatase A-like enzyme